MSGYVPSTFTGEPGRQYAELSQTARMFGAQNEHVFVPPQYESGDVESFLFQTGPLFAISENSWLEVNKLVTAVKTSVAGGLVAVHDILNDTVDWHHADQEVRSERRKVVTAASNLGVGMLLIEGARERAVGCAQLLCKIEDGEEADSKKEPESFDTANITVQLSKARQDPRQARAKQNLPPDVKAASRSLHQAYIRAFSSQHLAMRRLQTLMTDSNNVQPFIERLQEVIALRKTGVTEFPGLLETLNVYIAHTAECGGPGNVLHDAYKQATASQYNVASFTERLMSDDTARPEGQAPKDFQAMLLGARLVAQAVASEFGTDMPDNTQLAQAIVSQLGDSPAGELWTKAHSADSDARQQAAWRKVWDDLKRYNHRGRLPKASGRTRPPRDVVVRHRRSRPLAEGMPTQAQVEDIIMPAEAPNITLGVLQGLGGNSNFSIHELDSVDALLEHTIVTNFLRSSQNAVSSIKALRSYLAQLVEHPTNSLTTKTLERYFRVEGEKHRLRRYRPRGITHGSGTDKRIRVVFGLVPRVGSSVLALHDIRLRESTTY